MWSEPAVRRFLWDDKVVPRETVMEIIEASNETFSRSGLGYWMVHLKGGSEVVGFCGLRHFRFEKESADADEVEILYGLAPAHWGKGLATEAAAAVVRYGFEVLGLTRICAGADPPNQDSFRVMERLGMRFLRRTAVGELEAVYYVLYRDEFYASVAVRRPNFNHKVDDKKICAS
jgi:ribosomal-protein-alanine N-acetyltransferase